MLVQCKHAACCVTITGMQPFGRKYFQRRMLVFYFIFCLVCVMFQMKISIWIHAYTVHSHTQTPTYIYMTRPPWVYHTPIPPPPPPPPPPTPHPHPPPPPHPQRSCWGVYWFYSVCPSIHPSVCPTSGVCSVGPTVLVGSISYLHILSSNFRRCVAFKASCTISKFVILAIFLNL